MELLQLAYFLAVARHGHMTRAAAELRISQPSLSKTIAALEREVGAPLFDRQGRTIRLNACGEAFHRRAAQALSALEDGRREVSDLSGRAEGSIRLAVHAASHLLPELLAGFRREHPDIGFQLIQHDDRTGFDLLIGTARSAPPGMKTTPLVTEEIYLAVPHEHPLSGRRRIRLEEAATDGFISLKPGQSLREDADAFCRDAGFTPRILFESDDPATVRGLIRAGQGVAFIPEVSWGGSVGAAISLLHIEKPRCERTITISNPEERYLSRAAGLFLAYTGQFFALRRSQDEPR